MAEPFGLPEPELNGSVRRCGGHAMRSFIMRSAARRSLPPRWRPAASPRPASHAEAGVPIPTPASAGRRSAPRLELSLGLTGDECGDCGVAELSRKSDRAPTEPAASGRSRARPDRAGDDFFASVHSRLTTEPFSLPSASELNGSVRSNRRLHHAVVHHSFRHRGAFRRRPRPGRLRAVGKPRRAGLQPLRRRRQAAVCTQLELNVGADRPTSAAS